MSSKLAMKAVAVEIATQSMAPTYPVTPSSGVSPATIAADTATKDNSPATPARLSSFLLIPSPLSRSTPRGENSATHHPRQLGQILTRPVALKCRQSADCRITRASAIWPGQVFGSRRTPGTRKPQALGPITKTAGGLDKVRTVRPYSTSSTKWRSPNQPTGLLSRATNHRRLP